MSVVLPESKPGVGDCLMSRHHQPLTGYSPVFQQPLQ